VRTVFSNRNLMAVTLSQCLLMFASFLWRPFWGLYVLELGGSKAVLGALSTLQGFSNLLLQVPGGLLADRFGRRRVILVSSLFGFLPPLIYRFSTHWTMLIPGIIASSLSALAIPARGALIAESLPPERRATGLAAYPFGGYIMDEIGVLAGVRLGLISSFLIMVPIILVQWRFITETIDLGKVKARRPNVRASVSQLRSAPLAVWQLIVVAILSSFGFQIFWSFVVVYTTEVLGMSKMQWSLASIMANLVAALFMIPSGFLSDRARRRPYIILSQLMVSIASLGYTLTEGFYGLVVTRVTGGIGEGLGGNVMGSTGGPVWNALATEVAPAEIRGSILGLMGAFTGLVCTPAPLVGGYLYENLSPQAPFYASFGLGLIGCAVFTLCVREPDRTSYEVGG
jgi:MFS family permease